MSSPFEWQTKKLTFIYTPRNLPINVAACAKVFHLLCEFNQIIACHGLLGYPNFMNVDYLLCTELQHTPAQFLHIILSFPQNYCHVPSNTNVGVLSYGHVILGIFPRYQYHIVLRNMRLVNLIYSTYKYIKYM